MTTVSHTNPFIAAPAVSASQSGGYHSTNPFMVAVSPTSPPSSTPAEVGQEPSVGTLIDIEPHTNKPAAATPVTQMVGFCLCMCMYVCVCMCVCDGACVCVVHVFVCGFVCVFVHVCVGVCACVRVCVCVCTWFCMCMVVHVYNIVPTKCPFPPSMLTVLWSSLFEVAELELHCVVAKKAGTLIFG